MNKFVKLSVIFTVVLLLVSCETKKYVPDPYANSIRPSICGEWFLQSMCDADDTYKIIGEMKIVLPEQPRNALHGSAGINLFSGTADIFEKDFFCGTIAVTSMVGDDDEMESEENFLRLLQLCNKIYVQVLPSQNENTLETRQLILANEAEGIRLEFVQ